VSTRWRARYLQMIQPEGGGTRTVRPNWSTGIPDAAPARNPWRAKHICARRAGSGCNDAATALAPSASRDGAANVEATTTPTRRARVRSTDGRTESPPDIRILRPNLRRSRRSRTRRPRPRGLCHRVWQAPTKSSSRQSLPSLVHPHRSHHPRSPMWFPCLRKWTTRRRASVTRQTRRHHQLLQLVPVSLWVPRRSRGSDQ
jgi:hypothetical protein